MTVHILDDLNRLICNDPVSIADVKNGRDEVKSIKDYSLIDFIERDDACEECRNKIHVSLDKIMEILEPGSTGGYED